MRSNDSRYPGDIHCHYMALGILVLGDVHARVCHDLWHNAQDLGHGALRSIYFPHYGNARVNRVVCQYHWVGDALVEAAGTIPAGWVQIEVDHLKYTISCLNSASTCQKIAIISQQIYIETYRLPV